MSDVTKAVTGHARHHGYGFYVLRTVCACVASVTVTSTWNRSIPRDIVVNIVMFGFAQVQIQETIMAALLDE